MYSYNGGASMLRQLPRQMLRQRSESSVVTGKQLTCRVETEYVM
jgi:hypothetical protein